LIEKSARFVSTPAFRIRRVIRRREHPPVDPTEDEMRFMIIVKNTPQQEREPTPSEVFEAMGAYNQQLVDSGILLAAEGLSGSKDGAIVTFGKGKTTVKDGPFTEAKELIAGFWIIQVKSREEAIEWARRIPMGGEGEQVEVRRVAELSDFEGIMSPEAMAAEEAIRDEIAKKAN
jgi:hypothetical protein